MWCLQCVKGTSLAIAEKVNRGEREFKVKRTASRLPKMLFLQLSCPFNPKIQSACEKYLDTSSCFLTVHFEIWYVGTFLLLCFLCLTLDLRSRSHGIPSCFPPGPYFLKNSREQAISKPETPSKAGQDPTLVSPLPCHLPLLLLLTLKCFRPDCKLSYSKDDA